MGTPFTQRYVLESCQLVFARVCLGEARGGDNDLVVPCFGARVVVVSFRLFEREVAGLKTDISEGSGCRRRPELNRTTDFREAAVIERPPVRTDFFCVGRRARRPAPARP
jgi:hypothetical protein